ncbi:hypothetical protein BH11MYX1_BH11MYX1_48360 [soil metagenome]
MWLAALVVLASSAARADAPGASHAASDHVSITELTFTLRDDHFSSIATDPNDPRTVYVGTYEGRVYRTNDAGATWNESTVIPERKPVWSAPGVTTFLGALRQAGPPLLALDLIGRSSQIELGRLPSSLPRLPGGTVPDDPLLPESSSSAVGVLRGALGPSPRAPMLSALVDARGRQVPVFNRTLYIQTLHGTAVLDVTVDPGDRRVVFAATNNGLYRSTDRGESWLRVFAGVSAAERVTTRLAIRPSGSELLLLGTEDGAYTSADQAITWTKIVTASDAVRAIAFDPTDPRYVYLATRSGVLRSTDGALTFAPIFASMLATGSEVQSITIDPADPETAYIGTSRGAYVTRQLRAGGQTSWEPLAGVQSALTVREVFACPRHRDHVVAMTQLQLPTINYGADAPESTIIESWDGGQTWRTLFSGQSEGQVQSFAPDPSDPDELWIAWTTSLHRLERARGASQLAISDDEIRDPGPPLGELVLAALRYHGLELDLFKQTLDKSALDSLVPRRLAITGVFQRWSFGGIADEPQFASSRYLQASDFHAWQVMAWAAWDLPDSHYSADRVPILRRRLNLLTDQVRHQLVETLHRDYGELERLLALGRGRGDLQARVLDQVRIEQLTAVIDLASGGYLTRWHRQHRRAS